MRDEPQRGFEEFFRTTEARLGLALVEPSASGNGWAVEAPNITTATVGSPDTGGVVSLIIWIAAAAFAIGEQIGFIAGLEVNSPDCRW